MPKKHGRKTTAGRQPSTAAVDSTDNDDGSLRRERKKPKKKPSTARPAGTAQARVGGGGAGGEAATRARAAASSDEHDLPPARSKKQAASAARRRKKKGKGREIDSSSTDASSSHASDGASSDDNLGLDDELPDETHGDEPAPEPEELHRQRIEKEYKPVVEQAMQDKDEAKTLFSIWIRYKRCEMLKLRNYWKPPDSSNTFSKTHEWASISFSEFMHDPTLLNLNGRMMQAPYAAVSLWFLLVTSPQLRKSFGSLLKQKNDTDLVKWHLSYDDVSTKVPMAQAPGSLLYLLTRAGFGLYIGQSSTTGATREAGHRRTPVSERMELAREGSDFDKDWVREVVWMPPPDMVSTFSNAVLLILEHFLIVATDATLIPNLNTKPFDSGGYLHVATARGIDAIVDFIIEKMYPEVNGVRQHTGEHIDTEWVERHLIELQKLAEGPLAAGSIVTMLHGGAWAWRTRPRFAALPRPEILFVEGRLPVKLIADREERRAALRRVRREARRRAALPGRAEEALVNDQRVRYKGVKAGEQPKVLAPQAGEDWQDKMGWGSSDSGESA